MCTVYSMHIPSSWVKRVEILGGTTAHARCARCQALRHGGSRRSSGDRGQLIGPKNSWRVRWGGGAGDISGQIPFLGHFGTNI